MEHDLHTIFSQSTNVLKMVICQSTQHWISSYRSSLCKTWFSEIVTCYVLSKNVPFFLQLPASSIIFQVFVQSIRVLALIADIMHYLKLVHKSQFSVNKITFGSWEVPWPRLYGRSGEAFAAHHLLNIHIFSTSWTFLSYYLLQLVIKHLFLFVFCFFWL